MALSIEQKCYINKDDDNKFLHTEENLKQAYPDIDLKSNNKWIPVRRTLAPNLFDFQVFDGPPVYELRDGEYVEIYCVRQMTAREKNDKIEEIKKSWQDAIKRGDGFKSWVWHEEETWCGYMPPIPDPSKTDKNRKSYTWDEDKQDWFWDGKKYW